MTTALANSREYLKRYPLDVAVYAILTGNLGDSIMQPQTANRYLQSVVERSVVMNDARRLPMTTNTRNIDRLVHSGSVMKFPGEGTDVEVAGAIGFNPRQLIAGELMAAEDWSRQTIEDNIEGDNLENTIVEVMGLLHSRDLEELFLYGNADDSTNPAFPHADKGGRRLPGEPGRHPARRLAATERPPDRQAGRPGRQRKGHLRGVD